MPPADLVALSDEALIAMVCGGDPRARPAFDVLVERHHAWLVRLLTYILGDQGLGEDVAQECFVRAYAAMCGGERPDAMQSWLRTIGTRLAFNRRRDRKTRAKYHDAAPGPAQSSSLDERLAATEAVQHALAELPFAYAEILVLRYVEELDVSEIAAMLDLGQSAAKMRLKRARDEFAERFGGEMG